MISPISDRYHDAYAGAMKRWRDVLPSDAILDVRYEDVAANPKSEAHRILEHCGLSWNDACLKFYETSRPIRTASVVQVRQPIYRSSVGRWRPAEALLRPLVEALGGAGEGADRRLTPLSGAWKASQVNVTGSTPWFVPAPARSAHVNPLKEYVARVVCLGFCVMIAELARAPGARKRVRCYKWGNASCHYCAVGFTARVGQAHQPSKERGTTLVRISVLPSSGTPL
jgi:hypothetical protein